MTVGLIGYGYWGKIIQKSLPEDVVIFDPIIPYSSINDIYDCNNIFIATPVSTHYKYCIELIQRKKNIFCEKTLTGNINKSKELFDAAKIHDTYLFVDWIFLYNDHMRYIKNIIDSNSIGQLKSISMNRLNLGPVRNDVDARTDLAVHDISMLYYLLNPIDIKCQWVDYKRNISSATNDSCIALLSLDKIFAQVNCSWHYGQKDRICIFEFESGFLIWNDVTQSITINGNPVYINYQSPLKNAINAFISQTTPQKQIESTTLFVEKLLCM